MEKAVAELRAVLVNEISLLADLTGTVAFFGIGSITSIGLSSNHGLAALVGGFGVLMALLILPLSTWGAYHVVAMASSSQCAERPSAAEDRYHPAGENWARFASAPRAQPSLITPRVISSHRIICFAKAGLSATPCTRMR